MAANRATPADQPGLAPRYPVRLQPVEKISKWRAARLCTELMDTLERGCSTLERFDVNAYRFKGGARNTKKGWAPLLPRLDKAIEVLTGLRKKMDVDVALQGEVPG